ncbi:MAG: ATP-binding protein [Synergistaceae bacterium]|nr:ATP-binding protein [Synergistaceae bacterium]
MEYKSEWKDEYLAWICGFANAQGGKLFINIGDEGKIVGLKNARKLLVDLPNKISDTTGITVCYKPLSKRRQGLYRDRCSPSSRRYLL